MFAGDITGLNTVLSGSYVAMQPGDASKPAQRRFNGLADPPVWCLTLLAALSI